MKDYEECICSIALSQIPNIGHITARKLLDGMGNATDVFKHRTELLNYIPDLNKRVVDLLDCPEAFERAKREMKFVEAKGLDCFTWSDEKFPSRLRECEDAPIVLFYKGNADLNALKVISMVGTRNATEYGKQLCVTFLRELKELCPDVLVVSGLAYGIDVNAHRAALANLLPTVGVLAHGLDRIYPAVHRKTAVEMIQQGGLLTEFLSETNPDKHNFVSRNRIVAGMADATIVVESSAKGGSLITAELAVDYGRDCFAFPGRVGDEHSLGCNTLISSNQASLLLSAEDFVKVMGWDENLMAKRPKEVQRNLFVDLSDEEQKVAHVLDKRGNLQINALVVETNIPVQRMQVILFELEMKGVVRALVGGMYQLLH